MIAEVLAAVRTEVAKDEGRMAQLADRFKGLVARVQWSKAVTLVANSALTLSIPKIADVVGIFGDGDDGLADPTLQGFRDEFDELMKELEEIDRVVVLVDDLDRCLPDTVVAAFEAIKLFLSVRKMSFVIAADRRLVTLAIATRYAQSAQGALMAREYLEKIVQIPISVPTLGLADTEAYLAMMLLERHLADDAVSQLAEHCDTRRRAGEARTLDALPAGLVPSDATGELQLAGVLAPVLFRRLAGNPRRPKRFLNAFWLRSAIAERRSAALRCSLRRWRSCLCLKSSSPTPSHNCWRGLATASWPPSSRSWRTQSRTPAWYSLGALVLTIAALVGTLRKRKAWDGAAASVTEAGTLLTERMVEGDKRDERVAELTESMATMTERMKQYGRTSVKLAAASLVVAVAALVIAVAVALA